MPRTILNVMPPEVVVHDGEEACEYLPGRRASRPLRLPLRDLTPAEFDGRLDAGDRRAGRLLYTQECPACSACQPIRVDVRAFAPSRSQRRAQAKGDACIVARVGPLEADDARVALYQQHLEMRGLDRGAKPIDVHDYAAGFVASCVGGFEIRYFLGNEMVGLAITDHGARSLSAVYTAWDPNYEALSLGTYSILTQIALARREGLDWVYLGLAIEDSPPMAYKTRFRPHERRIGGVWRRFDRG
ncbi:MAG TPA: arginyltransferase [Polyangia bacterium]|nr:arginyltransferase [Polyangia bacterium]